MSSKQTAGWQGSSMITWSVGISPVPSQVGHLSPSSHAPIPIQVGHFLILKTAIIKHSLFRRAKESRFEHN